MGQVPQPTPIVVMPQSEEMRKEPARTIGAEVKEEFAGADDIRLAVASGLGIAAALGFQIAPGLSDNLSNLLTILVPIFLGLYARWQAERTKAAQATRQAERTRDAVYAPESVAEIIETKGVVVR